MTRRSNIWSFIMCLFFLFLSISAIYSTFYHTWSIAPPAYILFICTVFTFILGIIGFKDQSTRSTRFRSWFTVITMALLSFILFLGVFRLFMISEDLMQTTQSPDKRYTIKLYLIDGGSTSLGVKGELEGPLWFKKTIYRKFRMDHVVVEWNNNYTVSINNHILDLQKGETYSD
ncbi:DUF5412 family protein [Heyndrickxia sporothermodurans]